MAEAKAIPSGRRVVRDSHPSDLSPLTDLVGFNLGTAYGAARRLFMTHLADLQVRPIEFSVLAMLAGSNSQQVQLSAALNVSAPNMAVVLDRLAKRGLIRREANASDRRTRHIQLTPEGEQLRRDCAARLRSVEKILLGPLTPGEKGMFSELLWKLVQGHANGSAGSRAP